MATTYATNEEIRASFPVIDNILPNTKLNGAQDGSGGSPLTSITVDSTVVFPFSGKIRILDTSLVEQSLEYDRKDDTKFYLETSTTASFADNERVKTGDYQLDHHRSLAKAWVDLMLTNPNVPTDFKKDMEIQRVMYLVAISSSDPNIRSWAMDIMKGLAGMLKTIQKSYPAVIRQTIAKLVEDGMSDYEINRRKFGPNGDQ